jgi:hypothetical protein
VELVSPLGVADGMAGRDGSQSDFRVPESRIEPTATPFDENISQVGPVEGDPRFRLGRITPRRAVAPSAGFFCLTLATAKQGGRRDRRAIWEEPQSSGEP